MTTLDLTNAQVHVIARALEQERDLTSKLRATAEKRLADPGTLTGIDWAKSALREELDLAEIDALVGKLPPWVARFMARSV